MINNVVLVGRAGADPTIKTFSSGAQLVELNMAVNRGGKDKQETDWFQIKIWGKVAEIAEQYVKKGHLFGIIGELQQERWEKNGEKLSKVVVVARGLKLMQPKGDEKEESTADGVSDMFDSADEIAF